MNKRAGLEIGINTIVILVIAMVVIGGGIAFIRTFFKLGEEKLTEPFNLADFGLKPSSNEPLVLQTTSINLRVNEEKTIRGGLYNKDPTNALSAISISWGACASSGGGTDKPKLTSVPFGVAPNSEQGFMILLEGKKAECSGTGSACNLPLGTYICTIQALQGTTPIATNQVTVSVGN